MKTTRPVVTRLSTLVVSISLTACITMPGPGLDGMTGCYYFQRDEAAETLRLPWGVRLLPDALEGWPAIQQLPDVRRAITLVDRDEVASHPFGYWRPLGPDSLEIGYPAGGGLLLELAIEPALLEGRARPVGDALPPPAEIGEGAPPHPVSLVHARCPDEPA